MEAFLILSGLPLAWTAGALTARKLRDRQKKKLFIKINGWRIARGEMLNPWEAK